MALVLARFHVSNLSLNGGVLRSCVVCGCAFALIAAERILPF